MSQAYQRFLGFFSLAGRERLDGLDASYFDSMTWDERRQAFDYLLEKVKNGGTAESVHGLFLADAPMAAREIRPLLDGEALRPEAEIAAAWNLHRMDPNADVLSTFIKHVEGEDPSIRKTAVSYLPTDNPAPRLLEALKGLILTETTELTHIHATTKFLAFHGISESSDKRLYGDFYRKLRGENQEVKRRALDVLTQQYPVVAS